MRTLFINGKFLRQRTTGVQRFARGLVMALDRNLAHAASADRVVLLTPPGAEPLPLTAIEQRVCGSAVKSLTAWEQTALPWHARSGTLLCLSGSAPLLGGVRIPTLHDAALYLHAHAYSWKFAAWYRLLFSTITRQAPLALTVSSHAARELSHHLPGRSFEVVYNAAEHIRQFEAEPSVLATLGVPAQGYLLAVASFNPTKNLKALVAAYARLRPSARLPLVIVGGGNRAVFNADGAQESLPSGIIFAGPVSDGQLRALYENALAFVFPSLYEGFGIPPIEAMHCGCPVIASKASAIPEVCGDAALYFDATDTQDIARAIERIVDDSDLRAELVLRGKARSAQFSWQSSAETLRRHLRGIGLLEEQ